MASVTDFPARGKILSIDGGTVLFAPSNTNYELRLAVDGSLEGARVGVTLSALIKASPRKVWTVSSGGNFVSPIFGTPRTLQGRVRYLDESQLVLQAGVPIIIALPKDEKIYDLTNGPISLAGLINVSALPGASFKFLPQAVAV